MADVYVFDSNVFISLQRGQPRDIYPVVWNKIDELIEKGVVISSKEVYEELSLGDDALVEWANSKKDMFLPSEVVIQEKVREILLSHRGLVEGGKKMNSADPFVIAIAMERNGIVVTEEKPSNNNDVPKIPDVCVAYGIKLIDFVGFMREMKISFI